MGQILTTNRSQQTAKFEVDLNKLRVDDYSIQICAYVAHNILLHQAYPYDDEISINIKKLSTFKFHLFT